ncbi:inorganic phosphate transporter [Helicobacter mustelae]|uniref:Phosphate transporter n=1 Tax=Helicobacter mustelae (strain ATCC 43772 / CCUG 25715 / CIP 103759 / LMG 18044 / NCTC 12198 / R85-136P) TaxID=679897 RepID=D3UGL1_HELM1|nr:inorganic phosphate transporter [Helicobacter mustelae]CBG39632.1 possible phosphate permease [Helicobacter mustelae 12198]SQH71143.1 phosphate permease [Helicobacter mustelae]STP12271.1 phosphate permease [Helicobacter mustelae]
MSSKLKKRQQTQKEIQRGALVFFFILGVAFLGAQFGNIAYHPFLVIFSCVIGAYMAMNIGANDVANNVGPAVGSKSISMFGIIIIAAICELAGAILAGADVINTLKSGIIDPLGFHDAKVFVLVMLSALIAGALWLHLATVIKAPVSTTHSIVGGILGAGIAGGGMEVAKWNVLLEIGASWVISPLLGGLIAAGFLFFIKKTITYQQDKKQAAKKIVPLLMCFMTFVFSLYLIYKGLKNVIKIPPLGSFGISFALGLLVYIVLKPYFERKVGKLENTKDAINKLFSLPLVVAAAFLSFAHGANDVANAIGPLAAINQMLGNLDGVSTEASIPFWIMVIGGFGIALGLALYGPRLIKTVGCEITELNKIRAFCAAMSAAITVLIASALGLPVSSTHIAIGAIFGIGFLREYLKRRYGKMLQTIQDAHSTKSELDFFMEKFRKASVKRKGFMLESLKKNKQQEILLAKKQKKVLKKVYKEELVKRSAIKKIIASWLITVPVSAVFSALIYWILSTSKLAF